MLIKKHIVKCALYGYSLKQHIRSITRSKKGWVLLGIPIIWDQ